MVPRATLAHLQPLRQPQASTAIGRHAWLQLDLALSEGVVSSSYSCVYTWTFGALARDVWTVHACDRKHKEVGVWRPQ